jgi:hypothetical protein
MKMSKDPAYGEIFKKAFLVVWRHKIIWVFGILLTFAGGPSSINSGFNFPGDSAKFSDTEAERFFNQIARFFEAIRPDTLIVIAILAFIFLLALGLVFFFLSALLRGSLIDLVATAIKGETPKAKPALVVGRRKMLPIVGMTLLAAIPLLIIAFVLTAIVVIGAIAFIPVMESASRATIVLLIIAAVLLAVIGTIFFIVLAVALSIIMEFAQRFIVIDGRRAIDSIRQAYMMLRKNLPQAVISWLIMLAAGIPFSIAMIILLVVFAVPVVLLGIKAGILAAVILAIPLLLLMSVPAGYWTAFGSSFWTHVYLALCEPDEAEPPALSAIDEPEESSGDGSGLWAGI